jgi:hypothetical protein
MEINEFEESAPECPGLVVRFGLVGRKIDTLRLGTLAFPNTGKNTCTGGIANVREALDLKVQTTVIELVDESWLEVVGEDIIHQDAIVYSKRTREDHGRGIDISAQAAKEQTDSRS